MRLNLRTLPDIIKHIFYKNTFNFTLKVRFTHSKVWFTYSNNHFTHSAFFNKMFDYRFTALIKKAHNGYLYKNTMVIRNFIVTALFITTFSFSQNGNKNFIDQPYVEVTGTIVNEITPNEIYLNIVLNENNSKGKLSVEEQENQMIAVLKTLDIDLEKNFSILDFSGYFKRKFLSENELTKTKRYELLVNDGETLGKVYQALDRLNISNIFIAKVSHSDIERITRETKLKALKVAKGKADDYAIAVNQSIGKAILIQEIQNKQNSRLYGNNLGMLNEVIVTGYGSSNREKIQDLNFKTLLVSASIQVKFILN